MVAILKSLHHRIRALSRLLPVESAYYTKNRKLVHSLEGRIDALACLFTTMVQADLSLGKSQGMVDFRRSLLELHTAFWPGILDEALRGATSHSRWFFQLRGCHLEPLFPDFVQSFAGYLMNECSSDIRKSLLHSLLSNASFLLLVVVVVVIVKANFSFFLSPTFISQLGPRLWWSAHSNVTTQR